MGLRESFTEALKTAMKAGDAARTSSLRMILAKLKDTDIAARPNGPVGEDGHPGDAAGDGQVRARTRSPSTARATARSSPPRRRRRSRSSRTSSPPPSKARRSRPRSMPPIAETEPPAVKDMGKVMAALKSTHGAAIDLGRAGPLVKARLAA